MCSILQCFSDILTVMFQHSTIHKSSQNCFMCLVHCLPQLQTPMKSEHIPQRSWNNGTSNMNRMHKYIMFCNNECSITAQYQSISRSGRNEQKPTLEHGKYNLQHHMHLRFVISLEIQEEKKQRRGRPFPPPEVKAHSGCQFQLSCCIFYEESPLLITIFTDV